MTPTRSSPAASRFPRLLLGALALTGLLAAAQVAMAEPSAAPPQAPRNIAVKALKDEKVAFGGVVSYDQAGLGPSPMMYPAPGLAGALAALITHAVILESAKESQKKTMRDQANRVLLPYQTVLDGYKNSELLRLAMPQVTHPGSKSVLEEGAAAPAGHELVEVAPSFWLTQDQRALILDNQISIKTAPQAEPRVTVVRVISPPADAADMLAFWSADAGGRLKLESAALLATSLDIALQLADPKAPAAGSYKTVRYLEGGTEKIERAQMLSERCDRALFRTLRGNLMEATIKEGTGSAAASCASPAVAAGAAAEAPIAPPTAPAPPAAPAPPQTPAASPAPPAPAAPAVGAPG
ncbi:MAG: hypothetical protein V4857_03150 [Pseudomonadota bacterium]